jgi:hypothetical protein
MASDIKGSANVAGQISADSAGQTLNLNDDCVINVNGDAASQLQGIFIASNDGTVYKLSVSDVGALTAEAV